MIELTIADLGQAHTLACALNQTDPSGTVEVPHVVGPPENRRQIVVTGLGVKVDPETPLIPAPEA